MQGAAQRCRFFAFEFQGISAAHPFGINGAQSTENASFFRGCKRKIGGFHQCRCFRFCETGADGCHERPILPIDKSLHIRLLGGGQTRSAGRESLSSCAIGATFLALLGGPDKGGWGGDDGGDLGVLHDAFPIKYGLLVGAGLVAVMAGIRARV